MWNVWNRLTATVRALRSRRRVDGEAEEELQFHLEMATRSYLESGVPEAEARRMAARDLGGFSQTREQVREVRTMRIDRVAQDLLDAMRLVTRQRAFSSTAIATLAIGIGVSAAVLSAAWAILLRPLPLHDEATVVIGYTTREGMRTNRPLSWPELEGWRTSGLFSEVAAVTNSRGELTDGIAERIAIQQVTANFFRVLGVSAVRGRVFSESDLSATDTPAVISEPLWRARFGGDPAVLGRRLDVGRYRVVVVGIAPRRFERWRGHTQIWVPAERTMDPSELRYGYFLFTPVGRVTGNLASDAADRLRDIGGSIAARRGIQGESVRLVPLREDVTSPRTKRLFAVLLAGVALSWLVVCGNLSTLLLSRGPARAGELAVRLALGAPRSRIVGLLAVESLVLAAAGGALGAGAAAAALQWLKSSPSVAGIASDELDLGSSLLLVTFALALASALACGLGPAIVAARAPLSRGAASLELVRSSRRWSRTLVVAQVAISVVVLVGAALLGKAAWRIQHVDLGFRSENILTFQISLPVSTYGDSVSSDGDKYIRAQAAIRERLGALPGVEQVSLGYSVFQPAGGMAPGVSVRFDDGRSFLNGNPTQVASTPTPNYAASEFFALHGISVIRGREFSADDHVDSPRVIIVNQAAANLYWPDADPIGKRINFDQVIRGRATSPWHEVVGVVADARHHGVDYPARPHIFRAMTQHPRREFEVMLKTSVPPASVIAGARAVIRDFDSSIPMYAPRTLSDTVSEAKSDVRQSAQLLAGLALLNVILAAVGVFSVVAYVASLRRRDLAIRSVLGATPAVLVRESGSHAIWLIGGGLGLGFATAWTTSQSLGALLFDVTPRDPAVFGTAVTAVLVIAVTAAAIPAKRAARIDPVAELKR